MNCVILLGLVLAAVLACAESKQAQCYQCFYVEKNGKRQPGSNEACKDPEDDEDTELSVQKCNGKCFVQHTKEGKNEHWGRGCMPKCKDDAEEGISCCDGDLCNSGFNIKPTLLLALFPGFMYFMNRH